MESYFFMEINCSKQLVMNREYLRRTILVIFPPERKKKKKKKCSNFDVARILIAAITTLDFKEEFNRGCYLRKKYVLFSGNLGNVLMENFFVDKTGTSRDCYPDYYCGKKIDLV